MAGASSCSRRSSASPRPSRRRRAAAETFRFGVAGRSRVDLHSSVWTGKFVNETGSTTIRDKTNLTIGLQYNYYFRENLAFTFGSQGFGRWTGLTLAPDRVSTGSVMAPLFGLRWNPMTGDQRLRRVEPYLAVAVGPAIATSTESFAGPAGNVIFTDTKTQGTIASQLGAGIDFHVARSFSIGLGVDLNWRNEFDEPIGPHQDFNTPQFSSASARCSAKGA